MVRFVSCCLLLVVEGKGGVACLFYDEFGYVFDPALSGSNLHIFDYYLAVLLFASHFLWVSCCRNSGGYLSGVTPLADGGGKS